jgi:uncharacterized protein (DUF849 family)
MTGTLITVAPTGAETPKAKAPALPTTLDELVTTAKECEAAGAAVVHVHLRDADDRSSLDPGALREAVEALRSSTDLIVQLSTGGAVTDPEEARLAVVDAGPDMASLTCGTVNFGDDVFMNRPAFIRDLYVRMQERGVVPEFECFEPGHLATVEFLLDRYGLPYGGHVHVDLVMGVPGAMPGTAAQLAACVAALPEHATFSATGVGRTTLPVMLAALAHGGHLRVGMEDTTSFAKGQPVRDNAQLVERAATLASLAQRPPLTPDEARGLLGIGAGIGAGRERP